VGEELIFRGPLGAPLRRNNFHRSVGWSELIVEAGLPAGFHFHDLRHTGNNLAAASRASTRELMYRMGHRSMRARSSTNTQQANVTTKSRRPCMPGSSAKRGRSGPYVARRILNATVGQAPRATKAALSRADVVERVTRIELA
jgi:hypothetical protein